MVAGNFVQTYNVVVWDRNWRHMAGVFWRLDRSALVFFRSACNVHRLYLAETVGLSGEGDKKEAVLASCVFMAVGNEDSRRVL